MANHWAHSVEQQVKLNGELRLDPCHLPQTVAFTHAGNKVYGSLNEGGIFLEEDGAVSRLIPANQFHGIAASAVISENGEKVVALNLLHNDMVLSIPLLISRNMDDVLLDWRLWADTYGIPMLLVNEDGGMHSVEDHSPLQYFFMNKPKKHARFLLRYHGQSLGLRLIINKTLVVE